MWIGLHDKKGVGMYFVMEENQKQIFQQAKTASGI
jgi:hypothetical protein